MRVGVLSDTHDQRTRTAAAVRRLRDEGANVLIHCGDLTSPDIVYECADLLSYFVFGNNDFDERGLRRAITDIGGVCLERSGEVLLAERRIAVNHGDLEVEVRRVAARNPDYLLYGHSHKASDERVGTTRWINPGALHRAKTWTVALLDLETDGLKFLQIEAK